MQRREFLAGSLAPIRIAMGARHPADPKHPALIPYPREIQWSSQSFACARYQVETLPGTEFAAAELDRILGAAGGSRSAGASKIKLQLGPISVESGPDRPAQSTCGSVGAS